MCSSRRVIILLICPAFVAESHVRGAESAVQAAFVTEYKAACARLESYYGQVRGAGIMIQESRVGEPDQVRGEYDVRFWFDGPNGRCDKTWDSEIRGKPKGYRVVHVTNPKRAFFVTREAAAPSYRVGYVGSSQGDMQRNLYDDAGRFLSSPYAIDGEPLSRLISESGFHILEISSTTKENKRVTRVKFAYRPTFPRPETDGGGISDAFERMEGWIALLPEKASVIEEAELKVYRRGQNQSFTRRIRIEYEAAEGGIPLPEQVTLEWLDKKTMKYSLKLNEIEHSPASEDLFKLAAFGFPNLDGDPNRGWVNGYLLVGLMGAVGTTAWGVLARKRRYH
jgi:hypothetical protein